MDSPPTAYVKGIALQVEFPEANAANPTLDIRDPDGNLLGAKPIKQVDGTNLSAGHVAQHAIAELYYSTQGSGFWTLGAGARGATGPAGPPDGDFSLNDDGELVFTPTGGAAVTLGPATFRWRGAYASGTEYEFLNIVSSGGKFYFYINATASSGNAVSDTTYWQQLARDGEDATFEAFDSITRSASLTWDVDSDPNATITLNGNVTNLTLSNDEDGGVYALLIKQDGTGSRTFAFPSGWKWPNGNEGTIASAADAESLLTIRKIDSDIYAVLLHVS